MLTWCLREEKNKQKEEELKARKRMEIEAEVSAREREIESSTCDASFHANADLSSMQEPFLTSSELASVVHGKSAAYRPLASELRNMQAAWLALMSAP